MKAKKKPLDEKTPADYGVDVTPRLKVLKTVEPATRKAGVKVGSVDELIAKLKTEAGVLSMAVLILAKHDNATLERRHREGGHRGQGDGRRHPRAGRRQERRAVAEAAAKLAGVAKVIHVEGAAYGHRMAEPLTALVRGLAGDLRTSSFPAPPPARTWRRGSRRSST